MKTKSKFNRNAFVSYIVVLLVALVPAFQNMEAQKPDNDQDNNPVLNQQGSNQPKVDIKVNKKRDQNGNIIAYDSTYTSTWSNDMNGFMPENIDSIFKNMQSQFSKSFSLNGKHFGFNSLTINDSIFNMDPFNGQLGNNWTDMDKIMEQQQKMMEEFFKQHHLQRIPDSNVLQAPKSQENSSDADAQKEKETYQVPAQKNNNRRTVEM
jgi:hypothetical protein